VQPVTFYDEDTKLTGYVSYPEGKGEGSESLHPCVLVVHTAIGPQEDFIFSKIEELSRLGYVGFAVDMFGAPDLVFGEEKVRHNKMFKEDRRACQRRMLSAFYKATRDLERVDTQRIAAIGYCFGGKAVLDLARSGVPNLKGVASFHGILDHPAVLDHSPMGDFSAKVMVFHGHKDPFVSLEDKEDFKQEMETKKVNFTMVEFGGCYHAFTRPDKVDERDREQGLFYDKYAAEKSWSMMKTFLEEILL
jgi:dienelactone hydrolase